MNLKPGTTNQGRGVSAVDAKQRNRRFGGNGSGSGSGSGISPDAGAGNNCPSERCGAGGKHTADARNGEGNRQSDDVRLWEKSGVRQGNETGLGQRLGLNYATGGATTEFH